MALPKIYGTATAVPRCRCAYTSSQGQLIAIYQAAEKRSERRQDEAREAKKAQCVWEYMSIFWPRATEVLASAVIFQQPAKLKAFGAGTIAIRRSAQGIAGKARK